MKTLIKENDFANQNIESVIKKLNSYISHPDNRSKILTRASMPNESETLAEWQDELVTSDFRW